MTADAQTSDDPKDVYFTKRKLPKPAIRAGVKRLGIEWDTRAKALPAEISEFPAIEYLAVPAALVHTLETDMVPASLRVLMVSGGEKKQTLHEQLELPQLDFIAGFSKLEFRAAQVPNLTRVEVKLVSARMSDELAALPLRALGIGPVADMKVLAPFAKHDLRALSFMRGTTKNLKGLAFPNLQELRVKDIRATLDLGALATLPALRSLTIEWCTRLSNVGAIGKIAKLQHVNLWASKMSSRTWKPLAKTLEARGVTIQWPPN